MKETIQALNRQVADLGVLRVKLHNFHLFVTGPHFYQLHRIFKDLHDECADHLDDIAERVLQLGGVPYATIREYLAHATVGEARGNETAQAMVNQVIYDFTTVDQGLREAVKAAIEEHDENTADLLIGVSRSLQKHLWMLGSLEK